MLPWCPHWLYFVRGGFSFPPADCLLFVWCPWAGCCASCIPGDFSWYLWDIYGRLCTPVCHLMVSIFSKANVDSRAWILSMTDLRLYICPTSYMLSSTVLSSISLYSLCSSHSNSSPLSSNPSSCWRVWGRHYTPTVLGSPKEEGKFNTSVPETHTNDSS